MDKIIEVKNLTKIYKDINKDIIIFENLSFYIEKGDFISILGPSGSGKTTLLNLLSTLDSHYTGKILYNGKDIAKLNDKEREIFRSKESGFVFQMDMLLEDFNVWENISIPHLIIHKNMNKKKAIELLKKFNLEHIAEKNINELSGGERQRVSIMRALINNPNIIFADEPTGNLDRENAIIVMEDFKKLNDDKKTIIMVTHNRELAEKYSKKIYLIGKNELKKL
jgi:ABC-type lipoprotein export system ATPase subunit